jgi:hypothetical protein
MVRLREEKPALGHQAGELKDNGEILTSVGTQALDPSHPSADDCIVRTHPHRCQRDNLICT